MDQDSLAALRALCRDADDDERVSVAADTSPRRVLGQHGTGYGADDDGDREDAMPTVAARVPGHMDDTADAAMEVHADDSGGLTGVVWGAGHHNLWVNGEPTTVFVPDGEEAVQVNGEEVVFEDTITPTFEALQQRLEAADSPEDKPAIGFDHPNLHGESVAVEAGLVEIGHPDDVALSKDGREIAMTDSTLTSSNAKEAHAEGAFDGMEFSIVGGMAFHTDDSGQRIRTDDGALVVSAVRIDRPEDRIDVVMDGAVSGAEIGRIPELRSAARLAASTPGAPATVLTERLRAMANQGADDIHMQDLNPGEYDDLQAFASDVEEVVQEKDEQITEMSETVEALKPKADGFEEVAAAVGVDPEDDDAVEEVRAALTEDLRTDVAEYEAALAKYGVAEEPEGDDTKSVEERVEELKGKSAHELRALRGDRAHEFAQVQQRKDSKTGGVSATEAAGGTAAGAGGGDPSEDDEMALSAMGASLKKEFASADTDSPAQFLASEYDVDVSAMDTKGEVISATVQARKNTED